MSAQEDIAAHDASPVAPNPATSILNGITRDDADVASEPSLSRNARKRLLKAERFAASKVERRAREKEKKRERAEKRRAGDPAALEDAEQRRVKRRKVEGTKLRPKRPFKARVVVDLAFDDKMSEKEIVSLCSQLAYTYSSNRKSGSPFEKVLYTSLNGKTLARLNALGDTHKRWQGVEFWEEGYDRLWSSRDSEEVGSKDQACDKESVVYLSGDAEDELEELKEGETYIIGGICDRNRYKDLCLNKAKEQSIRSARLPIGSYLANLPTRKILTVYDFLVRVYFLFASNAKSWVRNQVFDILLRWVEERDWSKALYAVMPKRKFQQGSQSGGGSSAKDAQEEEDPDADMGSDDLNHDGPKVEPDEAQE